MEKTGAHRLSVTGPVVPCKCIARAGIPTQVSVRPKSGTWTTSEDATQLLFFEHLL